MGTKTNSIEISLPPVKTRSQHTMARSPSQLPDCHVTSADRPVDHAIQPSAWVHNAPRADRGTFDPGHLDRKKQSDPSASPWASPPRPRTSPRADDPREVVRPAGFPRPNVGFGQQHSVDLRCCRAMLGAFCRIKLSAKTLFC